MTTTQNDRLQVLLEPLAATAGVDLEAVTLSKVGGSRVLDVVVDADGGIDLDLVADLSRAFGEALDSPEGTAVLGESEYRLEVGSPGVDRLLTLPRHWRRARTRLVKAQLGTGAEVVGRVLEADDEGVLLEIPPVKGRGKATERRLEFAGIAKARVQVEFNRKGDDAEPADEDITDVEDADGVDDADGTGDDAEA
ncbi:ribosome maturation factor RimP [Streptacidiphilus sp. PB12-B1b]|uniref:ribosome maturation factor RimP n=1 Tax=Streptacidiphilus sp. PB12-B1b TaxID=2705012 RepID=UPI0015F7EFF0|nr:ribosome maturation factor RimP [Streptacidiphilus sp. PB12-B1b]QMU78824.1 ribosome maturation factor RimP [Streptacidiphilus sp. PB12-B1b]